MSFLDKLKGLVDSALKETSSALEQSSSQSQAGGETNSYAPSGFSWGENMPAEENQYNYPGDYAAYFRSIFQNEFSDFRVEEETMRRGNGRIFTFWQDSRKALVVEIKSQNSEARKLRDTCQSEGTPYLRFYHDHHGWWNTRAYVIQRTRQALGI